MISGSVQSSSLGSAITLPSANLLIVGVKAYAGAVGYLQLALDSSRNAILPFSFAGNITTANPAGMVVQQPLIRVHWTVTGLTLTVTATGVTSAIFYYGSAALPNSRPLSDFQAVVVSNSTTSATLTFTFPNAVRIMAATFVITPTQSSITEAWSTSSGRSITMQLGSLDILDVQAPSANPFVFEEKDGSPGLKAAQTLSVTHTAGVGVATYVILFYVNDPNP